MTYKEAEKYLYDNLPMYQRVGAVAYKDNLDNSLWLDALTGNPHRYYKTIHVAGTNGKGSVSHMLASVLQESGYKTGLFTSPHLKDFRERIRVNGKMISKREVASFVKKYREAMTRISPSFFEMTVAMAFKHFADAKVRVAVIETGLGGRLDSTNIIMPELCVITNIGMDHMALLGNTLTAIAGEKAGIIKTRTPVIIGRTQRDLTGLFNQKANMHGAPVYYADQAYAAYKVLIGNNNWQFNLSGYDNEPGVSFKIPLGGDYQLENVQTVAMATKILNNLGFDIPRGALAKGIENVVKNTGLRGRWQVIGKNPMVICDTGHNEDGLARVVKQIEDTPHNELHFVIGLVKDKDVGKILSLLPRNAIYYFTRASIPRAMDQVELQAMAKGFGLEGNCFPSVKDALLVARKRALPNDLIFIGGSTFIVAEAL